jgi:hypothetical protein
MNNKYELTGNTITVDGRTLYQIRALISFEIFGLKVMAGDLGGYIEKEECLAVDDRSWVFNNSSVYNSRVDNNSRVYNSSVYNSRVDNSRVDNNSRVYNSSVYNSSVYNSSVDNSRVDNSRVTKNTFSLTINNHNITITDTDIKWGCMKKTIKEWYEISKEEFIKLDKASESVWAQWEAAKALIKLICIESGREVD